MREAAGPKLKNYITPAGLQRLRDEHRFLMNRERPAVTHELDRVDELGHTEAPV